MAKRKVNNYVDNKIFTEKLIGFLKDREVDGSITLNDHDNGDYIGLCIIEICTNLARKSNFVNYTYKDDMIADAIENCVKACHNFKYEISGNAFGYFTRVAFNAFIRRIRTERKQRDKKLKVLSDTSALNEIIGKQFSPGLPGSEHEGNVQHFVDQLQGQLVESDQLMDIVQTPRKKRIKSNDETPLSKLLKG